MLSFNQFWKLQRLNNFTEGRSVCSYARGSRWDLWQYKNNKVYKTINKPAFLCFVRRQDLRGSRPDRINIRNPGTRRHNDMRGLTRPHMSSVGGHECMNPKRHEHTHRQTQTNTQAEFILSCVFPCLHYSNLPLPLYYLMPCYKQLISEQSIRYSALDRHSLRVGLPADAASPLEYRGAIRRGPEHMSTCSERQGQRHQHQERRGWGEERRGWGEERLRRGEEKRRDERGGEERRREERGGEERRRRGDFKSSQ